MQVTAGGSSGSRCGTPTPALLPPLHDQVAQAVVDRWNELPGRGKPQGLTWTVLAGIVAEENDLNEDGGAAPRLSVLSLATGTRCVGVSAMVAGQGRVLHDCHAEALCRRTFQRYLFREIEHGAGGERCILERCHNGKAAKETQEGSVSSAWQLKPGVRLHLYVSTLPCGECTLVPINNSSEGTLGRKWNAHTEEAPLEPTPLQDRNRTGAKPSMGMPSDPQADGIDFHCAGILRYKSGRSDTRPESRSVCYSCSDKICRWNHIGWQGALLARLIREPVTMASIVIGETLFDANFVRRALYGRALNSNLSCDEVKVAHCPEFCRTIVPFSSSREAVEGTMNSQPRAKASSTAGLSIAWSPWVGNEGSEATRSISRNISGFYDVLIGHTGERQGLRRDRQGAAPVGQGGVRGKSDASPPPLVDAPTSSGLCPPPLDSWVSPLSKSIMAVDALKSLASMLGSEDKVMQWLAEGANEMESIPTRSSPPPPKRQRNDSTAAGSEAAATEEIMAGKNGKDKATDNRPPALQIYAWLKDAAAGAEYRKRKQCFHSVDPFSHWKPKRILAFLECCSDSGARGIGGCAGCCEPPAIDGFVVETWYSSAAADHR